jgi:hypothetical protein
MPKAKTLGMVTAMPILAVALSSCSHSYKIEAHVEGGRLVFEYVRQAPLEAWFVCVNNLTITTDDPAVPIVPTGSGLFKTERRVWAIETPPDRWNACFADLPLSFGRVPQGAVETVKKHGLKPGVIYWVYTNGLGSGGAGRFRLDKALNVENLSLTPDNLPLTGPS